MFCLQNLICLTKKWLRKVAEVYRRVIRWGGGGGRGTSLWPPGYNVCKISRLCGAVSLLALDESPWNLVSFLNSKSRSHGYSLTGLYQIKLEKTMEGSTPSLIIHSFLYLLGVHQFSIRYSTSGRVAFGRLRPLSSVPG